MTFKELITWVCEQYVLTPEQASTILTHILQELKSD